MDLPLWSWVEKTVDRVKTFWISGKEEISGASVNKSSCWHYCGGMKWSLCIDFLENSASVNNATNC